MFSSIKIAPFVGAFILLCQVLSAQPGRGGYYDQSRGLISGKVILSPGEEGGDEIPGQGAVITVITTKKDTLHAVAGENGDFRIGNVRVGKAYVSFSLLGYKEESNWVTISPGFNKMLANLKPASVQIAEAVIKETVPPVKVTKDTIIFNAAAVKINKGERAVDILEQMPGVEVSDSGVKVLNEDVKAVYVDGALLFGNAPMKALNNLAAEEVVTIKSFQEYANKDPNHKISKNEEKQRVLDVATKSHPKFVVNADFLAGGGFDTDSTYHKFRYSLGGTMATFSEGLQIFANANVNNINNSSNVRRGNSFRNAKGGSDGADLRSVKASISVRRRWMSPEVRNFELGSLSGGYSYTNNFDVNESRSQKIYFPSDQYTSREVKTTSYSDKTAESHNFMMAANKSITDGTLSASADYTISKNRSNTKGTNYNYQDKLVPQGTSSASNAGSTARSGSFGLSASKGFKDKYRLTLSASYSLSKGQKETAKVDSTTSTATEKHLNIDTGTGSHDFSISPSFRYEISDNASASVSYSFSDSKDESIAMAMDVTNPLLPVVDTVNTHKIYNSDHRHNVSVGFSNHFDALGANLHIRAGYRALGLNKDEKFPEDDNYNRHFNAWTGSVDLQTESQINRWSVRYNTNSSTPALSQVRPKISNTNLYNVSAGNPDLRQNRSHSINLSYSTVLGAEAQELVRSQEAEAKDSGMDPERMMRRMNRQGNSSLATFSVSASFSTVHDPIVSQQVYFSEETYLPQYDYTMPAQSTFNTYINVSDSYSANANIRYNTPLNFIKCMFGASASASWSKSPSYVNFTLTNTENVNPSVNLNLRTNFSRNVRINLGATGNYVYSYNDQKNSTEYWTERINVGFELNNILKHIYAGGNYYKTFTQGLTYGKINDNIMNLNLGFRWGPKNEYDLSLAVHDLFNKTTGFSTSMNSNYITNNWSHNFGRYVFFTFAYRFNSMKGSGSGRGSGSGSGLGRSMGGPPPSGGPSGGGMGGHSGGGPAF